MVSDPTGRIHGRENAGAPSARAAGDQFSTRALVATIMLNSISRTAGAGSLKLRPPIVSQNSQHLQQAIAESIRRLRRSPQSLFAIEALLKAQWRTGDILGALKWVRRAMTVNPNEPGYYFTRGLLRQSLGMYREAMEDFEFVENIAKTPEMREKSQEATIALEEWQVKLVNVLFTEDNAFRHAFMLDPVAATAARGFRFTSSGNRALQVIAATSSYRDGLAASAGFS